LRSAHQLARQQGDAPAVLYLHGRGSCTESIPFQLWTTTAAAAPWYDAFVLRFDCAATLSTNRTAS